MKPRGLLLGCLIAACCCCTAGGRGAQRDYWPTKGWRVSAAEEVLQAMAARAGRELPGLDSILVVRHGYLVFERYFREAGAQELRHLFSITKSVVSILVGIALEEGSIQDIDRPALEFFPELAAGQPNPQAAEVSIRHLLTMSDGLSRQWMNTYFDAGTFAAAPRWVPGERWSYNNLSPQIVSNIITRATGQKALDFARERLFEPLGIVNVQWWENEIFDSKDSVGSYGLRLAPRDLAKIGYLLLKQGRWGRRQLVPAEWVQQSTRSQIDPGEAVPAFDYGFFWWVRSLAGRPAYCAQGLGGQWLCVVPELDLVGVLTSSETVDANSYRYLALLEDLLLRAARP